MKIKDPIKKDPQKKTKNTKGDKNSQKTNQASHTAWMRSRNLGHFTIGGLETGRCGYVSKIP